jgi:hypothetical protein
MTAKVLVACAAAMFTAAAQDKPAATFSSDVIAVTLNGGLRAQLMSVGRDTGARPTINAAVKITNSGKDYAFLMFYGSLSAIDDAGLKFEPPGDAVTGVGYSYSQKTRSRLNRRGIMAGPNEREQMDTSARQHDRSS